MTTTVRNIQAALDTITEPWQPHRLATVNDYDVKVVKLDGDFTWHSHPDTDELFLVLKGRLTIRLEDGEVELAPGAVFVVPRGQRHQPCSVDGAEVLLVEPTDTVNTGDSPSALTAARTVVDDE